jgi:ribokinase
MTVYNLGSINLDHIYQLDHLPDAGETLAADGLVSMLGGKGANQSIALARAGGSVHHIGAVGEAGLALLPVFEAAGVATDRIARLPGAQGHAIVMVDEKSGENQIILMPGSNLEITAAQLDEALAAAQPGDWALAQNETNLVDSWLRRAAEKGLKICYSAAPFVPDITAGLLEITDLLIVNEGEAAALCAHQNCTAEELGLTHLIITRGAAGADYIGSDGQFSLPAPKVKPVDTTGAGDTFLGYVLAGLDRGLDVRAAMELAIKASALMVTRHGTAEAIPGLAELEAFKA